MYNSGHEPSDEEELRAYQAMEERKDEERKEVGQSSIHPLPPTSNEEKEPILPQSIEDQLHDLTTRFDSF